MSSPSPAVVSLPLSVLSRLSRPAFVELASEMISEGSFEALSLALESQSGPEVIWSALKEADLSVRNLSHWGAAEREGMAEFGRRCAAAFLREDPQSARSDHIWSPEAAFGVESMDFFKGFALEMGQEELEAFLLDPSKPQRARLDRARAAHLFIAFHALPEAFQDKCMRADWDASRGLMLKPESPSHGGGLTGLLDERSEEPLRRALAFLARQGVDLRQQLSDPAQRGNGARKQLSCLQIALDLRLAPCVRAMLEAVPDLGAAAALQGLFEIKERHPREWAPGGRASQAKMLAQAESWDLDAQTRAQTKAPSISRSL